MQSVCCQYVHAFYVSRERKRGRESEREKPTMLAMLVGKSNDREILGFMEAAQACKQSSSGLGAHGPLVPSGNQTWQWNITRL